MSPSTPRSKAIRGAAALVAVAALAFGAAEITKSGSSSTSSAATPNVAGAPSGTAPRGAPPGGFGTPVTGSTLTRLKAVATAKYPGTVEQAMKLSDGSYVVHVLTSGGGEEHVLVSKDFQVTGVRQGGPRAGAGPSGQRAPSGTTAS